MQPAEAERVQNLILPGSAATASARRGAMRSFPWCGPLGLGAPKSFVYCTRPTTGKTIRLALTRTVDVVATAEGFGFATWPRPPSPGGRSGDAAATPAVRPNKTMREKPPRAVLRWRRIGAPVRARRAQP